jgi:hypothetical protein
MALIITCCDIWHFQGQGHRDASGLLLVAGPSSGRWGLLWTHMDSTRSKLHYDGRCQAVSRQERRRRGERRRNKRKKEARECLARLLGTEAALLCSALHTYGMGTF